MGVNFDFKGFFNSRLVAGARLAIAMFAIFFATSSFTEHPDRDLLKKQVNLMIRQIGHRLLLQAGDSTSRVLPVTEIKEGTFLLEFENEFAFKHDSLMMLSQSLLPRAQFPSGYTVTVHECITASIVYGFQINNASRDILGCRGRREPSGCYTIEIAFPDLYQSVEEKKSAIDVPVEELKSANGEPPEASTKSKEVKSVNVDLAETSPRLEELQSFKADTRVANSKTKEFKTTTFDYPLISLVYVGMLVLLGVTLLTGRFRKISTPVPVQNRNHSIIKESVPPMPALGKFLFDVKDQRLLLGGEVIRLTDKECKVLELLNENFGDLIPRETLMQKIWINEGVITGRSLDMFVSKLRKKLSRDTELRITNVHGKGYKLEIPGIQI